jgi:antitoxin component YwqK of YwqJK toxin-antitoxin module
LFYPNGKIESITYWKDGVLDGPFKSYFQNGQKQFDMYYEKGIRSENFYEWDETGDPVEDTIEN